MKLSEIKCILTAKERLALVEYVIGSVSEGTDLFSCRAIHRWLTENPFLVDRAADSLGISREHLYGLISYTTNIHPLTERHIVKVRVLPMRKELIEEKDDTFTNINLRLFLPELLEYEPEVLALGGGFWISSEWSGSPRLEALKEIREKLINQLNKEDHD